MFGVRLDFCFGKSQTFAFCVISQIKMKDRATGQTLVFVFDRWFSRDMDDHDLVRELPALKDNKPVSQGVSLFFVCFSVIFFFAQSI